MADVFRVHEVARVRLGKYAGMVGTVTAVKTTDGKQTGVRVLIDGVSDGEPINVERWFKRSEVERNQ